MWNDAAIREANPTVGLPDMAITPLRRGDDAPTTAIFAAYVGSKIEAEAIAASDEALLDTLKKTPGSIGYTDMMEAIRTGTSYGAVQNASKQYVTASFGTLVSAANSVRANSKLLLDATAADAYPLASYAFAAFAAHGKGSAAEAAHWLTMLEGRVRAQEIGLTPLPAKK
jgi:ABC-type phosphate transport system substrate-binding protein